VIDRHHQDSFNTEGVIPLVAWEAKRNVALDFGQVGEPAAFAV